MGTSNVSEGWYGKGASAACSEAKEVEAVKATRGGLLNDRLGSGCGEWEGGTWGWMWWLLW